MLDTEFPSLCESPIDNILEEKANVRSPEYVTAGTRKFDAFVGDESAIELRHSKRLPCIEECPRGNLLLFENPKLSLQLLLDDAVCWGALHFLWANV